MQRKDLNKLVTIEDLKLFEQAVFRKLRELFSHYHKAKQFYTPKEFSKITGLPYTTVIHYCNLGKLKARQAAAKGAWSILASEVERFTKEANDGLFSIE